MSLIRKKTRRSSPPLARPYPRVAADWVGRGLLAVLGTLLLTGCGYSTGTMHPANVRTVYVEMFQSREFRRGIEFQLTEALRKQLDRQTPYRNAQPEKADTILSGEVLEWQESTLGRDFNTALPRQTAATLVVRYRWQDQRTGKLLAEHPRMVTTVDYVRPTGETVYDAREDAANRLARKIVDHMASEW